jgi:hypothetical protein
MNWRLNSGDNVNRSGKRRTGGLHAVARIAMFIARRISESWESKHASYDKSGLRQGEVAATAPLPGEPELDGMTSPIDVTAMGNVDDSHNNSVLDNRVDHPEFTALRRIASGQLIAQKLTDAVRILR